MNYGSLDRYDAVLDVCDAYLDRSNEPLVRYDALPASRTPSWIRRRRVGRLRQLVAPVRRLAGTMRRAAGRDGATPDA